VQVETGHPTVAHLHRREVGEPGERQLHRVLRPGLPAVAPHPRRHPTTLESDAVVRFKSRRGDLGHVRIGELARTTGTTPRSLRYYEEQGLLRSQREGTGHRRYDDEAVTTVTHIRALLAAGVPTALIYDLLPCVRGPLTQLEQCAAPVLQEQLDRVDDQIAALAVARSRLRGLLEQATD
jgi:DNA-binding transcriptional MerR regulator